MGQEDYLKRQLDQLGQVLAKMLTGLLGLKNNQSLNDGIEQTNQTLKAELGFTSDELAALESSELIRILEKEKGFRKPHFEKLADLVFFIAENASEPVNRKSLYEKCLVLFTHIEQTENTYSLERHEKIQALNQRINEQ
jgi:hypothetical protein